MNFTLIFVLVIYSLFSTDKIQLQGKVVDNDGIPLSGVAILEKGTTNGTVTDNEGKFSIIIDKSSKLSLSFIGYESIDVELKKDDLRNNDSIKNIIISLDGAINFCCTNHPNSHCTNSFEKMKKLTEEKSCVF